MRLSILALVVALLCGGCHAQADPVEQQIDAVFWPAHAAGKFDGDVLVVRDNRVLYRRSFGAADRLAGAANRESTQFWVASVAKPFTAVLLLQLVEQGKVRVTDRLDAIFPRLAGKPVGGVTLDQLLSHTSGLEEVVGRRADASLTPPDLDNARITGKPGAFAYCSSGYVVLKLVIEAVGGADYETQLRERILVPAGMAQSGLARQGVAVPGLARAYASSTGTAPVTPSVAIERLDGAGSLYSTTDDLWRFDRALSDHVLLSAATQALMTANHTASGAPWAYGWALSEQGGRLFPYHRGDFAGYHAILVRQTHRREVVVILSNLDTADVSGLRQAVMRILKRTPPPGETAAPES